MTLDDAETDWLFLRQLVYQLHHLNPNQASNLLQWYDCAVLARFTGILDAAFHRLTCSISSADSTTGLVIKVALNASKQ